MFYPGYPNIVVDVLVCSVCHVRECLLSLENAYVTLGGLNKFVALDLEIDTVIFVLTPSEISHVKVRYNETRYFIGDHGVEKSVFHPSWIVDVEGFVCEPLDKRGASIST
jgi:hypothetical protein